MSDLDRFNLVLHRVRDNGVRWSHATAETLLDALIKEAARANNEAATEVIWWNRRSQSQS